MSFMRCTRSWWLLYLAVLLLFVRTTQAARQSRVRGSATSRPMNTASALEGVEEDEIEYKKWRRSLQNNKNNNNNNGKNDNDNDNDSNNNNNKNNNKDGTTAPSAAPSSPFPTLRPTVAPSRRPSPRPSTLPPTRSPEKPTLVVPTLAPTVTVTVVPTSQPATAEPTVEPTVMDALSPTTALPTAATGTTTLEPSDMTDGTTTTAVPTALATITATTTLLPTIRMDDTRVVPLLNFTLYWTSPYDDDDDDDDLDTNALLVALQEFLRVGIILDQDVTSVALELASSRQQPEQATTFGGTATLGAPVSTEEVQAEQSALLAEERMVQTILRNALGRENFQVDAIVVGDDEKWKGNGAEDGMDRSAIELDAADSGGTNSVVLGSMVGFFAISIVGGIIVYRYRLIKTNR